MQIYNAFSFTNKLFEGFFLVIFIGAGNEGVKGTVVKVLLPCFQSGAEALAVSPLAGSLGEGEK